MAGVLQASGHAVRGRIRVREARVEDVFKRVRLNVRKQSQGRQIPWESTSLEDDFVFNTGQTTVRAAPDEKAREAAFDAHQLLQRPRVRQQIGRAHV